MQSIFESGERIRRAAVKAAAIAQDGLAYAEGPYDIDRYQQLSLLAAELLSVITDRPAAEFRLELGRDLGYATPKVDVRGVIFDASEQVLLLRERSDGLWSLPGGWADPLDAPSVAIEREILEETGYPAKAVRLLGCLDRDVQGHLPKLPVHVYKLLFGCEITGAQSAPAELETLDVGWFSVSDLPPLSLGRVHARQIARALEFHRDPRLSTDFD